MSRPPRDAATVILARDGSTGIEVYLLRRNARASAMPDAYVFPGGAIDPGDRERAAHVALYGTIHPDDEPASVYAAIRETFEESGVLLARNVPPAEHLRSARRALLTGSRSFDDVVRDFSLALDADALHYYSRWITPELVPARFDARFYVARMPRDQAAQADESETFDGRWLRPMDALAAAERGEMTIVFPTRKHLERISAHLDVASFIAHTRAKRPLAVHAIAEPTPAGLAISLPSEIENVW
jgi:8-oxo-dGTP pyrophosphatase MutT (NUDIX family)